VNNEMLNPKAVLTWVGSGASGSTPTTAAGPSRPTLAKSFIDQDLEYIRYCGPKNPMPWELRSGQSFDEPAGRKDPPGAY